MLWEAGVAVTVKSAVDARAAPVPVRGLVCVPTESVTESVAVKVPAEVGAKVTAVVHEAPAASEDSQVLVPCRKLELFAPPILNEVMESAAVPALVRVKVVAALVVPALMVPKLSAPGVRAACAVAACTPVPVSIAVCVPT
jgi:hypothetical protein